MTPTASMTDHGQADELRAAMVDGIAGRHKALGLVLFSPDGGIRLIKGRWHAQIPATSTPSGVG